MIALSGVTIIFVHINIYTLSPPAAYLPRHATHLHRFFSVVFWSVNPCISYSCPSMYLSIYSFSIYTCTKWRFPKSYPRVILLRGSSIQVCGDLVDVRQICSSRGAFAALTESGRVVAWGQRESGALTGWVEASVYVNHRFMGFHGI